MADYSTLKAAITAVIRTNYNEEITGQILQDVLIGVVDALGSGYLLMGVATPATSPGTPDENVAYLAATNGTYTNFGGLTVGDEVALLVWDGSWHKQTLANAFTDTEKTKLAGIEEGAQVNPPIDVELDPDSHNAVENAVIAAAVQAIYGTLDTKADKNGEAPEAIVGTAQGLRGKVIAEMFTNRITGKGIVGSGAAMMMALRGRTLKWNQISLIAEKTVTLAAAGTIISDFPAGVTIQIFNGHKYLYLADLVNYSADDVLYFMGGNSINPTDSKLARIMTYTGADTTRSSTFSMKSGASSGEWGYKNLRVIDLTGMFGSGNEPTTVEDFEALYPLPYYAHNAGTLLPFKGTGIKTVGFNQWDEEMELGYIDTNGAPAESDSSLRSVNYIRVTPGADYYVKIPAATIRPVYYDANKQFISRDTNTYANTTFTIPAGACYIKFYTTTGYGTTYNHDICINLSDANRNGQYEPYHTETHLWPFTTATANNGEDVPFADGMNGYGGVYDTLIVENGLAKGGTKRISIRAYQSGDESDANVITDGVNTVYILSTPVEYTFDTPFPVTYSEDRDGTETVLPVGVDANGVPNTAPMDATIEYPINADQLISADSMRSYLEARKTAGEISAYTMVWNQTTQQYDFTITP